MSQEKIQAEIDEFRKKYPSIAKMTVADVVALNDYNKHLEHAINAFKTNTVSYYAFRSLRENKTLEVENFKCEYIRCLDKISKLPAIKRAIILDIGNNAYHRTVRELMWKQDIQNLKQN